VAVPETSPHGENNGANTCQAERPRRKKRRIYFSF
jgi:hypothetical protein